MYFQEIELEIVGGGRRNGDIAPYLHGKRRVGCIEYGTVRHTAPGHVVAEAIGIKRNSFAA